MWARSPRDSAGTWMANSTCPDSPATTTGGEQPLPFTPGASRQRALQFFRIAGIDSLGAQNRLPGLDGRIVVVAPDIPKA